MTNSSGGPNIQFFGDTYDLGIIGGKAASLARMAAAGMPVPPGFSVTSDAYLSHLNEAGLGDKIIHRVADLDGSDPSALASASSDIQGMFSGSQMPSEVAQQTIQAYRQLAETSQFEPSSEFRDLPVSVRSSATAEDSPRASFAGQHDTFLNIMKQDDVLDSVMNCWSSLWSVHAMMYRNRQGIAFMDVAMPVVVQKMVYATSAGVVFTANPVTGNPDEIMINACWGLGEAVVSGIVTPDHIVVSKHDMSIITSHIAEKETMIVRDGDRGTMQIPVPKAQRSAPVLKESHLRELCQAARALETNYGQPQDIEFSFEGDKLHLLQSRPITTL
jgi:pyruvate,water dikinase